MVWSTLGTRLRERRSPWAWLLDYEWHHTAAFRIYGALYLVSGSMSAMSGEQV